MKEFDTLCKKIEDFRDEMIDWQIKLTAIPALSPINGGEGETEKAELIKELLKEVGIIEIQEIKAPDLDVPSGYRPNLLAFYKGKSSEKTIWIMTHMDIVPPGELSLWKGDPYKAWVEEGKLYGRGVEDNQQEMIASIFAIKALIAGGIKPNYDIGLAIVADEETGSGKGIEYVLKNTNVFRKQDIIIVPDAGNEEGTMIEVAEKGLLWLKFHTMGKQSHGSMPHKGINSFRAASYLITELDKLYQIFDYKDALFDPPYSTFEPTKKEPNVPNVNTIPGDDVFYLDCRVMPKYSFEEIEAKIDEMSKKIENKFKVKIEREYTQRAPAAPPTPIDSEVVQKLKKAIKAVYNKEAKAMGIGGGTVAAFFRREGFNAAVWAKMDETAHQPNEYCIIDNMIDDAKVYVHIFLQE
ncbi:M20 family metallo-hydrolase [Candidatus Aminicenantes bacterium AH-873-B07]|jgi:succinyl-diaminopimelate desuccinylase|nr:M20 family metallo-hydrolase [Candidatus Aminicenantes bacterium AH-873-B07]